MALDFGAGCLGGAAGVVVGQPFDTVKVRLQVPRNTYRGVIHCVMTMIKEESAFSLYKGMTPPLLGIAMQNAIIFGLQGYFRRYVDESVKGELIAGAITGGSQAIITAPIELAKIKLQVQGTGCKLKKDRKYKGPFQTLLQIRKDSGINGCFRGMTAVLARDIPAFSIYFGSFAYLNNLFIPEGGDINSLHPMTLLFTGGFAGMLSWVGLYPIDVVKTRIQAEGMKPSGRYSSYADCAAVSFKEEGYKWMHRGFGATMLRAFPVNAAILCTVTLILRYSRAPITLED